MSVQKAERVARCMEMFDAANAEDPNRGPDGVPTELAYARRMSSWLGRLDPDAPREVRLAARAQHIRRWQVPRDSYPSGRAGYLKWRRNLLRFHADTAGAIMRDCGLDGSTVARVQAIIRKERFKIDPWAQLLEDVACLVFLEHYFDAFADKQDRDSMIGILRKTWRKMSETGQVEAGTIEYTPRCAELIHAALATEPE